MMVMPRPRETVNVAVIAGLVPTSPAGVSSAQRDTWALDALLTVEPICVQELSAASRTLDREVPAVARSAETTAMILVPAWTLAVVKVAVTVVPVALPIADWRTFQATLTRPLPGKRASRG